MVSNQDVINKEIVNFFIKKDQSPENQRLENTFEQMLHKLEKETLPM